MDNKNETQQYMNNPKAYTLKKWFMELLKKRYNQNHNDIVDRVSLSLATDKDLQEFGSLIAEVFESGYYKAVEDYKEQAEKAGLNIKIVPPKSS